jgi:D-alanine transfer protein
MKQPHLVAALLAGLLLIAGVSAGLAYATSLESRFIDAVAPMRLEQKNEGSALQNEAFRQPDLLPLYGSSELEIPDTYHVNKIFRLYPTGFATFIVGDTGAAPLTYLLRLAPTGPGIADKKVVILLSPQFFTDKEYDPARYAGHFSRLQAYELAFSTDLDFSFKSRVARRMLDYPNTLKADPVLETTLELLADDSPTEAMLYLAAMPIGKLSVFVLQLQDHWETVNSILAQADLKAAMPRRAARLHWPRLLVAAQESYKAHSNNNPFGFDNLQWDLYGGGWTHDQASLTDATFLANLRGSKGWTDLDLLLQALQEMHARPLILGIPFSGSFYDYVGVSAGARQVFYQMLRDAVRPYGMPLQEFQDHEYDKTFFYNPGGHLGSEGWVLVARAMDAFYHGAPLTADLSGTRW